jgi:LmbE family N-acetylglucosaminyl deacetylase
MRACRPTHHRHHVWIDRTRRLAVHCAFAGALILAESAIGIAQDGGAVRLHRLVNGLTVTPRVLVIGAHPDDVDPRLIAWLARGRMVETGYLSLTRGEGGDNFIGTEAGVALGAIRTQESIAARRIDGGESFFTRAFDFGVAKSADAALKRWAHDSLLGDIVTVIRSFRPQVIVAQFSDTLSDGNGQHAAIGVLAREAYAAAADTQRFAPALYGRGWTPLKLYRQGAGLSIDANEFDPVLGRTYADVALESRAQHRSQGLLDLADAPRGSGAIVPLQLVSSRVNDSTASVAEASIFDGIDTTFARLAMPANAPPDVAALFLQIAAYADSARRALDLVHPSSVVEHLARVAQLAVNARRIAPWCKHPSLDASPPMPASAPCDARWLDLDASIDLVRRRANEALIAAAGLTFDVTTDRELVAETDTVPVVVTMTNHGTTPVMLGDVTISAAARRMEAPVTVLPDSTARVVLNVSGLGSGRLWWIGIAPRIQELFGRVRSSADGIERSGAMMMAPMIVPGVAVPEDIRRTSDVGVMLLVAGATVRMSIGPVTYRAADPLLGVQHRPVGSVPAVTLAFERGLEWIPAGKPIDRQLRLAIKSFSDRPQKFALKVVAPTGVRVDSLPASITLAPLEQRELFLRLRGSIPARRYEFGVVGQSVGGGQFLEGFQSLRYPHIPPVHFYHSSALYLQGVEIQVPPKLVVAYVPGAKYDIDEMLRELGVASVAVNAEDLLSVDLSKFTTVVLGPRAYEVHPELAGQNARLREFVRNGGTQVVLNGQYVTTQSGVLLYPAVLSRPAPEHVTAPDAPVAVLEPTSRLFNFPNIIGALDWTNWVRERALFVPTAVDTHYTSLIETHDPGEKENRNALLVAPLGKGMYIYSTLTFYEQLPFGVPGGARLLVNLLSAGCRPKDSAARC